MHSIVNIEEVADDLVWVVIEDNQNLLEETSFFQDRNIPSKFIKLSEVEMNISNFIGMTLMVNKEKLSLAGRKILRDMKNNASITLLDYTFESNSVAERRNPEPEPINLPVDRRSFYQLLNLKKELLLQKKISQGFENYIEANSKLVSLGELTGAIVHDLNNYMTVCLASYSGVHTALEKNLGEEKVRKFTGLGKKAVSEIIKLSERCDSFIRGEEVREKETFTLIEVCNWVRELLEDRLKASNVRLDIMVNKSVNLTADRGIILQSILNLVKNSIDAVEESSCSEKWVEIEFVNKLNCAQVIVRDSGSISPECMNRAFELNFTTNKVKGHGLGLYLIKKKLTELNISINVRNLGQTEFILSIPRSLITFGM